MIYNSICFSERWLLLASSFELPFRRKWKGEDNVLNSKSCHSSFPAMLVFILLITYQFRWFSHTPICQQSTLWVLICSQISSNNMLRKYIAVDAWALVRYSTCHYVLFLHFLCIYFLIFYNSKPFFRWFRTNDTKLSTWVTFLTQNAYLGWFPTKGSDLKASGSFLCSLLFLERLDGTVVNIFGCCYVIGWLPAWYSGWNIVVWSKHGQTCFSSVIG